MVWLAGPGVGWGEGGLLAAEEVDGEGSEEEAADVGHVGDASMLDWEAIQPTLRTWMRNQKPMSRIAGMKVMRMKRKKKKRERMWSRG